MTMEAGNGFYRKPIWLERGKMKPLLGQKKIKELGRKQDVATMRILSYVWYMNIVNSNIGIRLIVENNQFTAPEIEKSIAFFEFKPKREFVSYYGTALNSIIEDLDPLNASQPIEGLPGTKYLSFIINTAPYELTYIAPVEYADQPSGKYPRNQEGIVNITLHPTEQAQIIKDIENLVTDMYNTLGDPMIVKEKEA